MLPIGADPAPPEPAGGLGGFGLEVEEELDDGGAEVLDALVVGRVGLLDDALLDGAGVELDAGGCGLAGVPGIAPLQARSWRKPITCGACALDDRYARSPIAPAVWSADVLSVAAACQPLGVAAPSRHTRMASLVGPLPSA